MSSVDDFRQQFDADGRFLRGGGAGEISVVFATQSGRFPGRLHFHDGLCVRAAIERGGDWSLPDGAPLDGVRYLLDFGGELFSVTVSCGRLHFAGKNLASRSNRDFLKNLRVARNLYAHAHQATQISPMTAEEREAALGRSAVWLTAKSVAGFHADDFPELGTTRQAELQAAIQTFLAIANEVPGETPATTEQLSHATMAFQKVLEILQPYLQLPEEEKKVEDALRASEFPPWVVNWDYELGSEHDGGLAVWVDLFVVKGTMDRETVRALSRLVPRMRLNLKQVGVDRWVYTRVKTPTDHKAG